MENINDQGTPGLTSLNDVASLRGFVSDASWADRPFWMLNVLRFKGGIGSEGEARYADYSRDMAQHVLPKIGGRLIFAGQAHTLVGVQTFHKVVIVEYPSPQIFASMLTSGAQPAHNRARLDGLDAQLLIPLPACSFDPSTFRGWRSQADVSVWRLDLSSSPGSAEEVYRPHVKRCSCEGAHGAQQDGTGDALPRLPRPYASHHPFLYLHPFISSSPTHPSTHARSHMCDLLPCLCVKVNYLVSMRAWSSHAVPTAP